MKTILVLAFVILTTVIVLVVADHLFYSDFEMKAAEVRAESGEFDGDLISEADLKELPKSVAQYIRFCGLVGKERINSMHVTHGGSFRPGFDKQFLPIEGEYYLTTRRPSFTWFGKIKTMPLITTSALDSYFNGKGRMVVKLLSIVNIVDAVSDETNHSALGRCFAEMSMVPSFYLDNERIVWTNSDETSAECIFTDGDISTNAKIFFNKDHSLNKVVVNRYYDQPNGNPTLEKFTGKCSEYKYFDGIKLATVYDGYWNLKSGDLHYVHFVVNELTYE